MNAGSASWMVILLAVMAGCSGGVSAVPEAARLEGTKAGGMAFLPQGRGTVYIVDADSGKLVYSQQVLAGDRLVFAPELKQVIFNGIVTQQPDLDAKRVHKLYFLKE